MDTADRDDGLREALAESKSFAGAIPVPPSDPLVSRKVEAP